MESSKDDKEAEESLEGTSTAAPQADSETTPTGSGEKIDATNGGFSSTETPPAANNPNSGSSHPSGLKGKLRRINIYFSLFIFVLLIAIMALVIGLQRSQKSL